MFRVIKKNDVITRQITSNKTAKNYITNNISPHVSLALLIGKAVMETETTEYNRICFVLKAQ